MLKCQGNELKSSVAHQSIHCLFLSQNAEGQMSIFKLSSMWITFAVSSCSLEDNGVTQTVVPQSVVHVWAGESFISIEP